MLILASLGLGLLGLAVGYAVAWLVLLFAAPAWIAVGIATFCAVMTATAVSGADGIRRFAPPGMVIVPAGGGALVGVLLSGVIVEDGSALGWWLLGALVGMIAGMIVVAVREA